MRSKCDVTPDWSPPGLKLRSWLDSAKGRCQIGSEGARQTIHFLNESHLSWLFTFKSEIMSPALNYRGSGSPRWEGKNILVPPRSFRGPTERRNLEDVVLSSPSRGQVDEVVLIDHEYKVAEPGERPVIRGKQFAMIVDVQS